MSSMSLLTLIMSCYTDHCYVLYVSDVVYGTAYSHHILLD